MNNGSSDEPAFEKTRAGSKRPHANGRTPSAQSHHTEQPEKYLTTPAALGTRLLEKYQDRILIVSHGKDGVSGWPGGGRRFWGEPGAYVLKDSGLWDPTPEPWRELVVSLLTDMETEARKDRDLKGKELMFALRAVESAQRVRSLGEQIRLNLSATAKLNEKAYPRLTRCTADDIDADLRYLGCENGVVDLRSGRLLDAAEGREHLVTYSTGVDFRPDEPHEDVKRLFEHLDSEAEAWFWKALAHALFGRPSRRIYLVVGPKGGGKTVMSTALVGSLGQYAQEPMDSALAKAGQAGQHNTELSAFASPTRVCVLDEVTAPQGQVSSALMKRLSGDGRITFRKLHQNPQTREATATLFLICNPSSIPRLHLEDEAMRDRLRELSYPAVPQERKDPTLLETVKTREFREAFLAKLIRTAATMKPGNPPENIPTVDEATAKRIEEDLGEIGAFAARIVPTDGQNLSVSETWKAWCEMNGADPDDKGAKSVGGVSRNGFTRRLRTQIPNLPNVKTVKAHGKAQRGWRGWRLEEPQTATEAAGE